MKKLLNELPEIEISIRKIDRLIYVIYPCIKEKKLLLKIINDIKDSITKLLVIILKRDTIYKKIELQRDAKGNLRTFIEKCAPRHNISKDQVREIIEILDIIRKHNISVMEIKKQDKLVILSEHFSQKIVTLQEMKEFSILTKQIFQKTTEILKSSY